ncbi:hypothetical protein LCGC14_0340870 [marine sediment metagenome]|uniref:Uncharacterized protein n=1 Tax=marine sediment metagenome TaxID=412755 RepID=A0A0F9TDK8_9ZZZZ
MINREEEKPPVATEEEIHEEEVEQPSLMPVQGKDLKGLAKDGSTIKNVVISLLTTIVVIMGLGVIGGGSFVTKSQFDENWANMQVGISTAIGDLEQSRETLNNALQGIPSLVSSQATTAINQATSQITSQLSDLTSRLNDNLSEIQAVKSETSQMGNRIAVLEANDISSLVAQNTALEARIKVLEDAEGQSSSGSAGEERDLDSLEFSMGYGGDIVFKSGETTTKAISLMFEVENTLDYDVEDVEVELIIHSRGIPINLSDKLSKVGGGYPLQWQKVYEGNGVYVIKGVTPAYGKGLTIESDDDVLLFVTVELAVAVAPTSDITFYVEGNITDYNIKE